MYSLTDNRIESGPESSVAGPSEALFYGGNDVDIFDGRDADDTAYGYGGNDALYGGGGNDSLYGGDGNDLVYGGDGADLLSGGAGNDTYEVDNIGDRVIESAGGGIDSVFSEVSWTLTDPHVENLYLVQSAFDLNATGNSADNIVSGNSGNNVIRGLAGDDLLYGGAGNDRLIGDAGSDVLSGGAGNDVLLGEGVDVAFDAAAARVYRLYGATLDRAPDVTGHLNWTKALLSGTPLVNVARGFVASSEFQTRFDADTTGEFVTLLYNNVLNRSPDQAGFENWVRQIDQNGLSRAEATLGFSESREYVASTDAAALAYSRAGHQAEWGDEVFRLYGATLDRAPDAGGFLSWTSALAQGRSLESVAQGFVASTEFQIRFDADTTQEFVTLLYNNVLDRNPDSAGLQNWVNAIDQGGMSRARATLGFSESKENLLKTAAAYHTYMEQAAGGDWLEGDAGTNTLFGGIGPDQFVFNRADQSQNRVAGIEAWDDIRLLGFGYASGTAALNQLEQVGRDVVFDDQGTRIVFEDARLSEFSADQFVF